MTYRMKEHRHPVPQRSAVDITTPVKLYVHNGTISNFAFPCWYQEVLPPVPAIRHNRELHDHHGWPNPTHPDHICQLWIPEKGHCIHGFSECKPHCKHFIDYKKVHPIHLLSEYEGYDPHPIIAFANEDSDDKIRIYGEIDEVEDWVVRLNVLAHDPDAVYKPQVHRFSVFLNRYLGTTKKSDRPVARDLVVLAELIVLPSAIDYYPNPTV